MQDTRSMTSSVGSQLYLDNVCPTLSRPPSIVNLEGVFETVSEVLSQCFIAVVQWCYLLHCRCILLLFQQLPVCY